LKPFVVLLALTLVAFGLLACKDVQDQTRVQATPDETREKVLEASAEVIAAIQAKDGGRLARLVHPQLGVRFSPYAFVDTASDRVLSRAEVARLWTDDRASAWGFAEGTGDPIALTPSRYVERYVMDRDFSHASSVTVNSDRARGNTTNNASEIYPQGTRVEYYLEPGPGEGTPELEWAALRLVFEEQQGVWLLIAVIHDEWTP
jgi:hypothetical protein